MVKTNRDYIEQQFPSRQKNKNKETSNVLKVVEAEVYGYKDKEEDVVIFLIQKDKERFTTTSTMERASYEAPGECGRDLVQSLFGVLPTESFDNKIKHVVYFKAKLR